MAWIEDIFLLSAPGVKKILYVSPACGHVWEMEKEKLYAAPAAMLERIHPEDL